MSQRDDYIDPRVKMLLGAECSARERRLRFDRLFGRPPTVAEIRFDFGEVEEDWADAPGREWCLDPLESVRVLLARIRELEEGPGWTPMPPAENGFYWWYREAKPSVYEVRDGVAYGTQWAHGLPVQSMGGVWQPVVRYGA